MRTLVAMVVALLVFFAGGCSPSTPPPNTAPTEAKTAEPEKPDALASDVPVPVDMQGRVDSTLPGSSFHVVQGTVPLTVPDAAAALRKQAEDGGWNAVGEPVPADDGSVGTLTFEKDARSLKITLVKVENTVTSVNILTGPK